MVKASVVGDGWLLALPVGLAVEGHEGNANCLCLTHGWTVGRCLMSGWVDRRGCCWRLFRRGFIEGDAELDLDLPSGDSHVLDQ